MAAAPVDAGEGAEGEAPVMPKVEAEGERENNIARVEPRSTGCIAAVGESVRIGGGIKRNVFALKLVLVPLKTKADVESEVAGADNGVVHRKLDIVEASADSSIALHALKAVEHV